MGLLYVNPGLGKKRVADTSGHVVMIGEEPVMIQNHMEAEARKLGCVSVEENDELKRRMEEEFKEKYGITDEKKTTQEGTSAPSEVSDLDYRAKVKEVMETMLDSEDESYFTSHGMPRAGVVEEKCGFQVPKEMREEVWDLIKAENDDK